MKHLPAVAVGLALAALAGCFPEQWAEVSPDGRHLVYTGLKDNHPGVFLMTLDGKEPRRLAASGFAPQFSPDGRYVAFQDDSGLVLYELASQNRRLLVPADKQAEPGLQMKFMLPQWRPDGRALAVTVYRNIRVADQERQETALLLFNDLEKPEPQVVAEGVGLKCGWSPDGKRLAFFRKEGPGAELPESELYWGSINIREGNAPRAVAGVLFNPWQSVQWLATDRLLFVGTRVSLPMTINDVDRARPAIHAYDLVTKGISLVFEIPGGMDDLMAQWFALSPDRKRLLYCVTAGGASAPQLRLYDIATGESATLATAMAQRYPFWVGNDRVGLFVNEHVLRLATVEDLKLAAQLEAAGKADEAADHIAKNARRLDLKAILAPLEKETPPALTPAPPLSGQPAPAPRNAAPPTPDRSR